MKESNIRPQALFNKYLELSNKDIARFFNDRSGFIEVPCPACGSEKNTFGLKKLGFRYMSCECGSLYLSPRPKPESISEYYRESEAVKFWATHFFKETAEARRKKMFKPRAKMVSELADMAGIETSAIFVDVGAGYGIFLEEVDRLRRFEKVVGIEPAPDLAAVCRNKGFDVIEKPMEEVVGQEICANFATAFEVIEHLYEPLDFLTAVRQILKPVGLFVFTTLTVTGFDIQVLWEHSKSVYPPHHINLISVEGMRILVERSGLEIADLTTPGELDVDIVHNTLKENPNINLPRFIRKITENPDNKVKENFQTFLKNNKLSSHIQVVSRPQREGKSEKKSP